MVASAVAAATVFVLGIVVLADGNGDNLVTDAASLPGVADSPQSDEPPQFPRDETGFVTLDCGTPRCAKRAIGGEYASAMAADITQIDTEILANRVAILATLGPDGRPQQTPIWFIVEDDKIKMSVSQSRQKYRNLVADGRGTVLIFHPDSEHYYVEIRGDIEVTDDLDFAFADRLGPTKYATDMRSFDAPNARWATLSLAPTKINVIDVRGAADQALAEFLGDVLDR